MLFSLPTSRWRGFGVLWLFGTAFKRGSDCVLESGGGSGSVLSGFCVGGPAGPRL